MLSGLALWLTCIPVDTTHAVARPTEWHRATTHGHWIYYTVRGHGPTLVLLHGGGDSGEHSFVRQLDAFSELIILWRLIKWARDTRPTCLGH